ncbi:cytochrome b/b6 domain-containing protein [Tumebacillus flagellatus]|uniref:Cytochrome b561 bacterial/Ni-hydrogenase domain-containing protein n=1 Tax=Tumebacillus flagellatus TaxID=1157490 RepID=A0A074LP51_9BACL|nr:cytochrome b/b6 domain-containing protein [Tumebacillus flagellatus]KEO82884.1 hypothetical protein EL26_13345 [Tumebacillus flagellatus]
MKWVQRFNGPERFLHAVVALLFLVLWSTGLCLHVEWLRESLGAWRFAVRTVHDWTGLLLMIVPWSLVWVWRQQLAAFFREMTHWRSMEVDFLAGRTKRAYKFNGGQKLNFLVAILLLTGMACTGFLVWKSQWISLQTREFLYNWHKLLFYLLSVQVVGHVFLAAVYKPTRHALQGMMRGRVLKTWAEEHHPLWKPEEGEEIGE